MAVNQAKQCRLLKRQQTGEYWMGQQQRSRHRQPLLLTQGLSHMQRTTPHPFNGWCADQPNLPVQCRAHLHALDHHAQHGGARKCAHHAACRAQRPLLLHQPRRLQDGGRQGKVWCAGLCTGLAHSERAA